jgi:hypothetical protein
MEDAVRWSALRWSAPHGWPAHAIEVVGRFRDEAIHARR